MFRSIGIILAEIRFSLFQFWLTGWGRHSRGGDLLLADREAHVNALTESFLRQTLRGTPWWGKGHLRLAECALQNRDETTAFVSIEAVLALSPASALAMRATVLKGELLLRRGLHEQARSIFEQVVRSFPLEYRAREGLIATLIASEAYHQASEHLAQIPEDKRTLQLQSVVTYLERKSSKEA